MIRFILAFFRLQMVITKTPYRVSFFGGGTDYSEWYREHGGSVLTSTIDKYCFVLARYMPPFLGTRYRVFWSKMEMVNTLDEIQHVGVRACLRYLGIDEGFEINHAGDLPARSGLGSSSAFTVGMLNALHVLKREHVPKEDLAREAMDVEQNVLKETVGIQDQIECAHGGVNLIEIRRDGSYDVQPVIMSSVRRKQFERHCMLFFTGLQRSASEVAAAQVSNAHRKGAELRAIAELVPIAVDAMLHDEMKEFGALLDESWAIKRTLSDKVSNPQIDGIYARARQAGAYGGKILGAGSGGFMLIFAAPDVQRDVREALAELLEVPFAFEYSGTQIVLS